MVLWGAVWGTIITQIIFWLTGISSWGYVLLLPGVLLGALLGYTLRRTMRAEWSRWWQEQQAALPAPMQTTAPAPAAVAVPYSPPAAVVTPPPLPAAATRATDTASWPDSTQPFHYDEDLRAATPTPLWDDAAPLPPRPSTPAEPTFISGLTDALQAWFTGGNLIVRIGVLVLFAGLVFLAKYAAQAGYFPPAMRLATVGAIGVALFVAGYMLRGKALAAGNALRQTYALTLQGAGVAVLYLTLVAAYRLYALLPSGVAFAFLVLVCAFATAIALLQNSLVMAFVGFAGGFAAPILVSDGSNNFVGLFSYYILLNAAIVFIAWKKAWRPLNLLGFLATFGVFGLWMAHLYSEELYARVQPFLIVFFALYLMAALFYALRHQLAARKALDGVLLYGNAVVTFALQAQLVKHIPDATAFSALVLGAVYIGLSYALLRRADARQPGTARWLGEGFLALGTVFVTLTIPLALDARWTAAVWAVQGVALYAIGLRQRQWLLRLAGLVLQALASISLFSAIGRSSWNGEAFDTHWLHPQFLSLLILAATAWLLCWLVHTHAPATSEDAAHDADTDVLGLRAGLIKLLATLEGVLPNPLLMAGMAWWLTAWWVQCTHAVAALGTDGNWFFTPWIRPDWQPHVLLLIVAASLFAVHHAGLPQRTKPLHSARALGGLLLPVLLMAALYDMNVLPHFTYAWGWAVWPIAVGLHVWMLRRLDGSAENHAHPPWYASHVGGVLLLLLLLGNTLYFAIDRGQLWGTAWSGVVMLVAGTAVLLLLSRKSGFDASGQPASGWPWRTYGKAYTWTAAGLLAAVVAVGALLVAVWSRGNARPLPYIPLINPTDLSVLLALAACAYWLRRARSYGYLGERQSAASQQWLVPGLAVCAFIVINTVWLRMVHHYWGVAWNAGALFASFITQAGYSILWTLLALALMVQAHRRIQRTWWIAGAGLLALTLVKLLLIDLSNSGGVTRILTFIAVGTLMLVVGYFAPLPPQQAPIDDTTDQANEELAP